MRSDIVKFSIFFTFFLSNTELFSQQLITTQSGIQIYWTDQNNWYIKSQIKQDLSDIKNMDNQGFVLKKANLIEDLLEQEAINTVELYINGLELKKLNQSTEKNDFSGSTTSTIFLDSLSFNQQKKKIILLRLGNIKELLEELYGLNFNPAATKKITLIKNSLNSMKSSLEIPNLEINNFSNQLKEEWSFPVVRTDVIENPPRDNCSFSFSGTESISGKKRLDLYPGKLFSYTHPQLADYFEETDYLNCSANLSWLGGYTYLSLNIVMNSTKANLSYGQIQKGSPLHVEMINGDKIYLRSVKNSEAQINLDQGSTLYQASFVVDKSRLKDFSEKEISKISILWSKGLEEYQIQHVDAIMYQAKCLKSKL